MRVHATRDACSLLCATLMGSAAGAEQKLEGCTNDLRALAQTVGGWCLERLSL